MPSDGDNDLHPHLRGISPHVNRPDHLELHRRKIRSERIRLAAAAGSIDHEGQSQSRQTAATSGIDR